MLHRVRSEGDLVENQSELNSWKNKWGVRVVILVKAVGVSMRWLMPH